MRGGATSRPCPCCCHPFKHCLSFQPYYAWCDAALAAAAGLFGFPPKDLQYRFLCRFTPVFYIRQRDYSKSVAVRGGRWGCTWGLRSRSCA